MKIEQQKLRETLWSINFLTDNREKSFLEGVFLSLGGINVIHYIDYLLFVLPLKGELGAAVRVSPIRPPTTHGSLLVFSTDFLVCSI
jgi:hypothetical protein